MTTRTAVRALAVLVGALFVAACGGSAATSSPAASQAPVATEAPVATQAPGATTGGAPQPSFHSNTNLEKLIPAQIGGEAITTQSISGETFLGSGLNSPLTGALTTLGKKASDLSVAFGNNSMVQIIAFQVNGVPSGQTLDAFIASGATDATITDTSYGGKAVKKIAPADGSEPSYAYTKDDVVFVVGGAAITEALLTEVFSKLP